MATDTPDPAAPETSTKDPLRQWHRAFGIALIDVFAGADELGALIDGLIRYEGWRSN